MRLIRLDLQGFKSFFHRTSLALPSGISAVVGPNGCGKSNIADAIRWVMGEQSPSKLRGRAMEDVIFSGSASNKSLGLAEVSLTVARTNGPFPSPFHHYEELTVTRRLYRSGESDYLINKIPCRLKDIINLFLDSGLGNRGYAVIEQGSVARIIDSRPEDRRSWLEEAAGVVKFKTQRQTALRKMEQTSHNLERVADILAEVKRQADSLRRQAKKAERHRGYTGKIRKLDLALCALEYHRQARRQEEQEARQRALADQRELLVSREAAIATALEADRLRLTERERALADLKEERLRLGGRVQSLEQEQEHLAEKTADLKRRLALDGDRLSSEEARLAELAKELEELGHRRQSVEEEYQKRSLAAEEIVRSLDSVQASAAGKMRAVAQVRERLVDLISRRAQADNAVASAQQRLDSLAAHGKRQAEQAAQAAADKAWLEESLKEGRRTLRKADEERERLKAEQAHLEERLSQTEEELSLREAALEEAREERRRLAGQLEGLEALAESHEGVADGVKALLTDAELTESLGPQPFLGLIAEGIRAEADLEPAVEAALAGGVEFLAVRDPQALTVALKRLSARSSGRADLMTEALLSPSPSPDPPPAGAKVMAECLDFTGPVGPLARALVGVALLADDLATAIEVWQADGRQRPVVTLRGELIRPPGVVSAGRPAEARASLLARRRRIKELAERLGQAEKREAEAASRQESAKKLAAAIKEKEQTLAGRMRAVEGAVVEAEKEVAALTVRLTETSRLEEVLAAEAERTLAERAEMEEAIARDSALLNRFQAEQAELDEALSQAEDQAEEASQAAARLREELSELKVTLSRWGQDKEELNRNARRLQEESQRTAERIRALQEELARAEEEKEALASRRAANEEELRGLTIQVRQQEQKIGREAERLAIYQQELSERAAGLKEARQELRRAEEEAQEANLALSATRLSLQHLAAGVQERLQVDLTAAPEEHLQLELDESAAAVELAELRARVERMGPVNPAAMEEFAALEERRGFLEAQVADLTASMNDLKQAIRKINKTSLERFMTTFREVAAKITDVSPILFGEGTHAEMVLTDPDNPLDSGVDLMIQPPGKKLVSMSLLSGGEKALAAVTLLFAIFLHQPSPFCLLDEVDAPLDEANVDRFNSLLREIGKQSQILMITHNRRTMEVVDTLFGVTMPEPGVSRLVSVNMEKEAA